MSKLGLSIEEASEVLGISTSTLYSMVRSNEIPHSKIRGRIIFHYPTLEEWLINGASRIERDEKVKEDFLQTEGK